MMYEKEIKVLQLQGLSFIGEEKLSGIKPVLLRGEKLSKLEVDNHSLVCEQPVTLNNGEKKVLIVASMISPWIKGYDPTHVLGMKVSTNAIDVIGAIKDVIFSCSLSAQERYITYEIEVKNISSEIFNGKLRLNISIDYLKEKDRVEII